MPLPEKCRPNQRPHIQQEKTEVSAKIPKTRPATPRINHLAEQLEARRGRLGNLEIGRTLDATPMGRSRSPIRMPEPWQLGATIAVSSATTSRLPLTPGITSSFPARWRTAGHHGPDPSGATATERLWAELCQNIVRVQSI